MSTMTIPKTAIAPTEATNSTILQSQTLPLSQTESQQDYCGKLFLSSLLDQRIRIHTKDKRVFAGRFTCTDRDLNIILAGTSELRPPSLDTIQKLLAKTTPVEEDSDRVPVEIPISEKDDSVVEMRRKMESLSVTLKSRYLGLVVVPGSEVVKIEMEED